MDNVVKKEEDLSNKNNVSVEEAQKKKRVSVGSRRRTRARRLRIFYR